MATVQAPLKVIFNGPPTPQVPAPVVVQTATGTFAFVPEARPCSKCSRPFPPLSAYSGKWCELCREKARERWRSQKKVQATPLPSDERTERDACGDVEMADVTSGGAGTGSSATLSGARKKKKRKAEEMEVEVPGEFSTREEDAVSQTELRTEYQTGKDLLDALSKDVDAFHASSSSSSASCPPYINFRGSYTIVMDPDIPGKRRTKLFAGELKTSAKLRVGNLAKRETNKSCGGHARTYWCLCDPPKQPALGPPRAAQGLGSQPSPSAILASSQAAAPPKHSQSTLADWLGKSKAREGEGTDVGRSPPPGCGGTITVYAHTDLSHPLGSMGVKGQKIVVHVEHPGRDIKRGLRLSDWVQCVAGA